MTAPATDDGPLTDQETAILTALIRKAGIGPVLFMLSAMAGAEEHRARDFLKDEALAKQWRELSERLGDGVDDAREYWWRSGHGPQING